MGGTRDDAYVSSSSPGGGTSRTPDDVRRYVWLNSPDGGTRGEVCRFLLLLHFAAY